MLKTDIAILGGGLAGLSAGYFLKINPAFKGSYLIFEKEKEAGGLCRSRAVNGFIFDYDGHLLHFRNKGTERFIKGLLGAHRLIFHRRNSSVRSGKYEIPYPFQNYFLRAPAAIAQECLLGFIKAGRSRRKAGNFREWLIGTFGSGIYKHFMFPYNRKFWTINPASLSCEWLDGFIPAAKLEDILKAASRQDSANIGYNAHFFYPQAGGIEAIPAALAKENNACLHLACEVTMIDLNKKTIILNNREKAGFKHIISSLPLPELLKIIPGLPPDIKSAIKRLRYSSIYVLNLGISRKAASDKHWIYFPAQDTIFYRVGFPVNFSSAVAPAGTSSLYAEVSYSANKPLRKGRVCEEIKRGLIKTGILRRQDGILAEDAIDIKYGYPIYDRNYKTAVQAVIKFLASKGVSCIGRYGRWKYMSMEDVIIDAWQAAGCPEGLCWRE